MTSAECVQKKPFAVEVEPGDYYWCACGRSKNQPFCDGSHSGTGIEPVKFSITQNETIYLCGCKASKNPPYCDGTHKEL